MGMLRIRRAADQARGDDAGDLRAECPCGAVPSTRRRLFVKGLFKISRDHFRIVYGKDEAEQRVEQHGRTARHTRPRTVFNFELSPLAIRRSDS